MYDDYGSSDLFGFNGPDDYQENTQSNNYDLYEHDYSVGLPNTGGNQYQFDNTPQFDLQSNLSNVPNQSWFSQPQIQLSDQENAAVATMPDTNWNPNSGGLQNTLAQLFNSKGFDSGMRGLAALLEGSQNKKKSSQLQQIVNNNRTMIDPFGSQRPFYQQQLQSAVTDPYSAPIVKNQVDQIALAQARKDAAAGRRSNSATSDPAMLAAQAKVAQDYINSLYTPAGAGINPNSSAALSLLEKGTNADVNGYISPLMSALGYGTQQNSNTAALDAIKQALAKQGG